MNASNTKLCSKLAGAAALSAALLVAGMTTPGSAWAQAATPATASGLPQATVKALQEALNRQGIQVTVDGALNEDTRAAIKRYQSQHHLPPTGEPDKATLDKLGVATGPSADASTSGPAATTVDRQAGTRGTPGMMGGGQGGMPGMMGGGPGMPGMMGGGQGGMPGMMGGSQGGMPGMMGGSQGGMSGMMGMMGGGQAGMMSMCPMMQSMGQGPGGAMHGMHGGAGMLYGMPRQPQVEMTPERVRQLLEQRLAAHGNPRLKLGPVASGPDGSIVAEIVTVDGSLVQKLAFNRYPGLVRQITE
jgi:hypothetical protein